VSGQSLNVALISTLGTVVVALIVLAGQWLNSRGPRTTASPPEPAPHIGERVAVTEVRTADNARTLDVLDRHVDGIDDRVDKLEWKLDDLLAWRDEHRRSHGQ
jgi:hypothetical protein